MGKGEQTRQMIIERSAALFNTKGIAATAMSDIMEVTGLSKGCLYVHFENKEVLAEAVIDFNMQLLSNKMTAALDREKSARDKLYAYIDLYRNPLTPPVSGGCPMMNFGVEVDDQDEQFREKVADMVNKSQQRIVDIIAKGIRDGEFKPTWNYKEFATTMFALIEGGTLISRTTKKIDKMQIIGRTLRKMIEAQLA